MAVENVDLEALIRGRRPRRRWLLPVGALVALLVAAAAFVAVQPGESDVVVEPQPVEATLGRLTSTIDLSGSAAAAQSAEGQLLALLDDADAQRRVETAEIALRQAELRLAALTADAAPADIAGAQQATASARAQLASAEQSLATLTGAPGTDGAQRGRRSRPPSRSSPRRVSLSTRS